MLLEGVVCLEALRISFVGPSEWLRETRPTGLRDNHVKELYLHFHMSVAS